jgi:glycosyltransferase involved in cell wall biosynthesis
LPELKRIVEGYDVGKISNQHNPVALAAWVDAYKSNFEEQSRLKANCRKAALQLSWENEVQAIRNWY